MHSRAVNSTEFTTRPINFVDPTGHVRVEAATSRYGDSGGMYCSNGVGETNWTSIPVTYFKGFGSTNIIGLSGFVSQILSVGESSEIAWDDNGVIALMKTWHYGIGTQQISALGSVTTTNADGVERLRGGSTDVGGSFESFGAIGFDVIKGDGYEGVQISAGPGLALSGEEAHIRHNETDYLYLYDTKNNTLKINVSYLIMNVCGAELAYFAGNGVDDAYILELEFD